MAEDTRKPPKENAESNADDATREQSAATPGHDQEAASSAEPRRSTDAQKSSPSTNTAGTNTGQLVQDAVIYGGVNIYEVRESVSFDPATIRQVRESRRMDPHRVQAICATFVAPDEDDYRRFAAEFQELCVGVVVGNPGTGRAASAISVLGATGLEVAEVTSDAGDRGGRLDHLPAEPDHAYLLDITALKRGRVSHHVRRYAHQVRECGSRIIIVAEEWDDDPVDGYALLRAQPASPRKVFFQHLRYRTSEAVAERWSAEPQIRDLVAGNSPAYAARVAKEVQQICAGGSDADSDCVFAEQVRVVRGIFEDLAKEVREWFASHERQTVERERNRYTLRDDEDKQPKRREDVRPGDYLRVLIEAVAVLEGCPSDVVMVQVDELAEKWNVPVAFTSPISGGGLTKMLDEIGAAVDDRDRIRFRQPGMGNAVLDHLWREYPKTRESLLTWSDWAVRKIPPQERRAVADRWFDLAERQSDPKPVNGLLAVWGQDSGLRSSAVPVVVRAAVHDELGPAVRSYLYSLARNGPDGGRLDVAVAQVCGQYGRFEPHAALVRLSHLADRVQGHAAEELHSAVDAISAEAACRPALLEALLEWEADERGRGRAEFARGYLAELLSSTDDAGRPLILQDLGDGPDRIPLQRIGDAIAAALTSTRPRDSNAVADAWIAGLANTGHEEGVFEEVLLRAAASHTGANVRLCRRLREWGRRGCASERMPLLAEHLPRLDPLTISAPAAEGARS
ncbi:hypothetical protein [Streptomonospora arabica]|uniref:LigA protein n=1 Tax=Streptomonospora arabica TaxID=412417 RepID=A0ABV9SP67_9ACTN